MLDAGTNTVLTISPNISSLVFLQQCTMDSVRVNSVDNPNYRSSLIHEEPFFLARAAPQEYPRWAWDRATRTFFSNKDSEPTPERVVRSKLATAKCVAVQEMMHILSRARQSIRTGVEFQDRVYTAKKFQAQRFKDAGYAETAALDAPFLLQYADVAGIPLKQAADEILFQAKLDDDILLKTECLRLKYFRALRKATDPEEIPKMLEKFIQESVRSSLG